MTLVDDLNDVNWAASKNLKYTEAQKNIEEISLHILRLKNQISCYGDDNKNNVDKNADLTVPHNLTPKIHTTRNDCSRHFNFYYYGTQNCFDSPKKQKKISGRCKGAKNMRRFDSCFQF